MPDNSLFVSLTPEEERMLRQFAKTRVVDIKDTCTRNAFFVVEREVRQSIESECGNIWVYDGSAYEDVDELLDTLREERKEIPLFEDVRGNLINDTWIDKPKDLLAACGEDVTLVCEVKYWRPVAFFFTHAEAIKYRDGYQAHNCKGYDCKTRVYAYSDGYDNRGDFPAFQALLLRMGRALLESEGAANEG